jgi:hypothetical protein
LRQLADLRRRLADAKAERSATALELDPYRPALDAAHRAVTAAQQQRRSANHQALHAKGRHRRQARKDVDHAERAYAVAITKQHEVEAVAGPARAKFNEADNRVDTIESTLPTTQILIRWSGHAKRASQLRHTITALDDWHDWATGKPTQPDQLTNAAQHLLGEPDPSRRAACQALANTIVEWADHYSPDLAPSLTPQPAPPTRSLGIELDF